MNSIDEHDFVVMIISDSYLKSRACMYEVLETMKNVYDISGRVSYAKYWVQEEKKLQKLIESIDSPLNQIKPIKE
ncbi:hypothetical protein PAECIP111892_03134 [Paenibacillus auburnensis]|uniref:TIR domain-containing protein n=1 Tax=Paenibacillus auburnensis TaxID=2905649 RepID=A0ABN8GMX3_9BACL|nr:toll/interleukin-1 receptor domain-containing protein [Paenibacillus auburnensis]CAH1208561.1 hypothetical protein PAECIP111892_03134 [Paenibacillus auburnensis]